MRWAEEVLLLREGMHRVLAYLSWHASWWLELANIPHILLSDSTQEGIAAYAYKQAHLRTTLRSRFERLWRDSAELANMGVGADNEILDLRLAASSSLFKFPVLASPMDIES